jgi:hypothetical protein
MIRTRSLSCEAIHSLGIMGGGELDERRPRAELDASEPLRENRLSWQAPLRARVQTSAKSEEQTRATNVANSSGEANESEKVKFG